MKTLVKLSVSVAALALVIYLLVKLLFKVGEINSPSLGNAILIPCCIVTAIFLVVSYFKKTDL